MTTQALILAISKRGESVVLAVHGELDLDGVRVWTRSFTEACTSSAQRITIDLGGVTFIDCSGLHMLLLADRAAEGLGLCMRLTNVPPKVTRLFELCALVGYFNVTGDGLRAESPNLSRCIRVGDPSPSSPFRHAAPSPALVGTSVETF